MALKYKRIRNDMTIRLFGNAILSLFWDHMKVSGKEVWWSVWNGSFTIKALQGNWIKLLELLNQLLASSYRFDTIVGLPTNH